MNWSRIPGSHRFLEGVRNDLSSGVSGTLVIPEIIDSRDVATALCIELRSHMYADAVIVLEADRDFDIELRPVLALAHALEDAEESPVPSLPRVVSEIGDRVVLVTGLEGASAETQAAWSRVLNRISGAKAEVEGRVDFALIVLTCGMELDERPETDPGLARWDWRDVLGVEDIFVHLQFEPRVPKEPLVVYQAAELSGGDLVLAENLIDIPPVDVLSLGKRIRERGAELGFSSNDGIPPAESGTGWTSDLLSGRVQEISGHSLAHPACLLSDRGSGFDGSGEDQVLHRMWLSQVRSVLPRLEVWRSGLATLCLDRGLLEVSDPSELDEFGSLHHHLRKSRVGNQAERGRATDLASKLRTARNRIAHHNTITAKEFRELKAACVGMLDSKR